MLLVRKNDPGATNLMELRGHLHDALLGHVWGVLDGTHMVGLHGRVLFSFGSSTFTRLSADAKLDMQG